MSAGEGGMSPAAVRVKEEPERDDMGADSECGASEAAAASLYAEHEVKRELVLGPERLQPQDTPHDYLHAYTIPHSSLGVEWCSVKQEPAPAAGPGDAPRSGKSCGEQLALRTCFDKNTHACAICHKTFRRECTLKTHLCIQSAEETSSNITQSHLVIKVRKSKPHSCRYCGKVFRLKSYLTNHKRIHTGEKPFKCNICTQKFSIKRNLTRHMLIHTGEKPFQCNMCTKQFSRNERLATHMLIHTGEKPFKCDMCTKLFLRNRNLAKHMQIHLGEKSFSCNICKRFFSQKVDVNTHICNAASRARFGRAT